jgi:hypothetical protein
MIFRIIPHKRCPTHPSTDFLLAYAQRFDFVPQPAPQSPMVSNNPHVEPSTGMHLLKQVRWSNGSLLGDVVPLRQVRALLNLVPHFGTVADNHLTKEMSLEHSSDFWLNKYFDKELFNALNCF